ncbi:MAG: TlpA family protein disulfide reductase [Deltaproteobacteria bacterium]|nr:TlpA family protein disulfide reductase [Deltaproteobacteria bacterium]MBW2070366.1 TlpA family protein disulfide reductase [Deltaproteobacteria bacterium]
MQSANKTESRHRALRLTPLLLLASFFVLLAASQSAESSRQNLILMDEHGKSVNLTAQLANRPTLLYFWATWCKPCRKTQPKVVALAQKYGDKLQIIGINVGGLDSLAVIRSYRSRYGISYLLLRDHEDRAVKAYEIFAIPTFLLLDRNGRTHFRGNDLPTDFSGLL